MTHRYRPSPEALAMAADPANRDVSTYDPALLPQIRRGIRAEADAALPGLVAKWGLTLEWQDIDSVSCLVITPDQRSDGVDFLYLFGGGFITGGPVEDLMISGKLAAMTGRRVVSPAYRLAPEHPFPAALDDVEAVAKTMPAPLTIAGQCAALARAIRDAGGEGDLRLWDSLWHVFEYYDIPEADLSLREIAAFITDAKAAR